MNIPQELRERVQASWNRLPDEAKSRIYPLINAAHVDLTLKAFADEERDFLIEAIQPNLHIPHQLFLVKSALEPDTHEKLLLALDNAGALPAFVDGAGDIIGVQKYEILDPGWLESAIEWFDHLFSNRPDFPANAPAPIIIPNQVSIAITGDWGTGNYTTPASDSPSAKVGNQIATQAPDYTIHLGDVYYAGTPDAEQDNLVNDWPSGSSGSFTLNSNHEMMTKAVPYWNVALASQKFAAQNGLPIFILENDNWVILGLDSAYEADKWEMYADGNLNDLQGDIITYYSTKTTKKIIILTHHNGFSDNSDGTHGVTELWSQIMDACYGGNNPTYWIYGHIHTASAYADQATVKMRCVGHGGIPHGQSDYLQHAKNLGNVIWFENTLANDPSNPLRVLNGFYTITLNDSTLTEQYYDENGQVRWSN